MGPAIQVADVSVTFPTGFRGAGFRALDRLDLRVDAGEIVGILGPNGSGKTTLLRVLGGLLRPDGGQVRVLGCAPTDRSLVSRVGYQPEGAMPFPTLTGREFVGYMGDLMRLPAAVTRTAGPRWLERLGIADAGRKAIRDYSTGMRRRLALAVALLADPAVLLLDEPTSGLDPEGSLLVMDILRERATAGTAILLASHHLQEVEQLCDRVYLLDAGRVVREGSLDQLLGTGDTKLVVRDLSPAGLHAIEQALHREGGAIVEHSKEREHLFALFRRLRDPDREPS